MFLLNWIFVMLTIFELVDLCDGIRYKKCSHWLTSFTNHRGVQVVPLWGCDRGQFRWRNPGGGAMVTLLGVTHGSRVCITQKMDNILANITIQMKINNKYETLNGVNTISCYTPSDYTEVRILVSSGETPVADDVTIGFKYLIDEAQSVEVNLSMPSGRNLIKKIS